MFDDYLGLGDQNLANMRAVVFSGPSGAGKSSYLQWLIDAHPAFCGRDMTRVETGRPLRWPPLATIQTRLVVVDEALKLADLWKLVSLVARGHTVLAASHLSPMTHRLALPAGSRLFDLATDTKKIGNALTRQGYQFSQLDLVKFKANHGSSYTAMQRIVAEWPGPERDFGAALRHFECYCSVRTVRQAH
ncbi:MAG: hypothetical protein AAF141_00945 [Pseudomonadota bacterium]